jgi:hypothetical protein
MSAASPGAGVGAVGQPRSATINIPPPSADELAEMDASRDRTIVVSEGMGFFDDELKTAIGALSPFEAATEARPVGQPPGIESTLLRPPAPLRAGLVPDTGYDLRPIEMTGFHPAHEEEGGGDASGEDPPRARPRLVIGDAPISAPTTIGPTPFAHPETRLFDEGAEVSGASAEDLSGEYVTGSGEIASADADPYETSRDHLVEEDTSERELPVPRPSKRAPRRLPPRPNGRSSTGRRGLLIAIAATGMIALGVLGAALMKLLLDGSKSGIALVPMPKSVRFSVTVKPGERVYNESAKQVELAPGPYLLQVHPSSPEIYGPFSLSVTVREGEMSAVPLDFKAHLQFPDGTPRAPPRSEERTVPAPAPAPAPSAPPGPGPSVAAPPAASNHPPSDPPVPAPQPSSSAPLAAPGPRQAPEPAAEVPPTWSAAIYIDEPGAEIFVDGRLQGTSPKVELSGLTMGRSYEGQAKKAGFKTRSFTLGNPRHQQTISARFELEPSAVKRQSEPERAPSASPTVTPKSPTSPKGAAKLGKLTCTSDPVGAEVIIDGKPTGRRTPVPRGQELELPFGKHRIVFRIDGRSTPPRDFVIGEEQREKPLLIRSPQGEL